MLTWCNNALYNNTPKPALCWLLIKSISFFNLFFSWCLFSASLFITILALRYLSFRFTFVMHRLTLANVGIRFSFFQDLINFMSGCTFIYFDFKDSYLLTSIIISSLCFLFLYLNTLLWACKLITKIITRDLYMMLEKRN